MEVEAGSNRITTSFIPLHLKVAAPGHTTIWSALQGQAVLAQRLQLHFDPESHATRVITHLSRALFLFTSCSDRALARLSSTVATQLF